MWNLTFSIALLHMLLINIYASQDEIGFLRNQIQQLRRDLAVQKVMNAELRSELHQSRFRRGMI